MRGRPLGANYQTIWLLAQGHTVPAVSAMMNFAPRSVEELLARYNAIGEVALGDLWRNNGTSPSVLKRENASQSMCRDR